MPRQSILIADDEPSIRRVLSALLRRDGHEVEAAAHGGEAMDLLSRRPYQLLITDLRMPEVDGMELLAWCRANLPELPVIVLTAHGTVNTAVEAIKLGAHDYITKPFDQAELRNVVGKALALRARGLGEPHADASGISALIGATRGIQRVHNLIGRVADSPSTVLIQGESGTGKELVARALHDHSSRRAAPFICVNCGAIPAGLFESELFGHEKGAFTGAVGSKPGRFELAHGGTLFLDEVSELPRDTQVKLLRVLQERSFERVGGIKTVTVDVRVVAATNRDLGAEVAAGRFREDLFYRLNVVPITIPPLRARMEDIPLLAGHFLTRFNERLGRDLDDLTPAALARLQAWAWPGNVRELENVMERAVLLAEGARIEAADLHGLGAEEEPAPTPAEDLDLKEYVRLHLARLERTRIQRALDQADGNVTHAAGHLGISRKSLQTKMKAYGLRDPERSGEAC
ncbi:MAG: sigma-54 dependent transcriptional regulator [Pseudomonadota bacterium]